MRLCARGHFKIPSITFWSFVYLGNLYPAAEKRNLLVLAALRDLLCDKPPKLNKNVSGKGAKSQSLFLMVIILKLVPPIDLQSP
jgi:hypothetical protein